MSFSFIANFGNYLFQDIQRAFLLLFLLVIVGEFFSAPAITLADAAVLSKLGDDVNEYGFQRMFGSIGWGDYFYWEKAEQFLISCIIHP